MITYRYHRCNAEIYSFNVHEVERKADEAAEKKAACGQCKVFFPLVPTIRKPQEMTNS